VHLYILSYLLNYTVARGYKTGNNTETVEAKVTINGLNKVVHGLSIAAKMYDLECPLSEIQGHLFLNSEIQLSNDSDVT